MLNQIKEYAMEKYAGDEAKANAFVEGFQKEAIDWTSQAEVAELRHNTDVERNSISSQFTDGITNALGKGVGGLGVGLAIHGLNTLLHRTNAGNLHTKFLAALEQAIRTNPILRDAKREKVEGFAETCYRFAPNVSTDPNLLASILSNSVHGDSVDPQTIKMLGDLESRYVENLSQGFSPKQYV